MWEISTRRLYTVSEAAYVKQRYIRVIASDQRDLRDTTRSPMTLADAYQLAMPCLYSLFGQYRKSTLR